MPDRSLTVKLNEIEQIKGQIREAIESKGVSVPQTEHFNTYPDKILEIDQGGGNDPVDTCTVVFSWIDENGYPAQEQHEVQRGSSIDFPDGFNNEHIEFHSNNNPKLTKIRTSGNVDEMSNVQNNLVIQAEYEVSNGLTYVLISNDNGSLTSYINCALDSGSNPNINWGDGSQGSNQHTYAAGGVYLIEISHNDEALILGSMATGNDGFFYGDNRGIPDNSNPELGSQVIAIYLGINIQTIYPLAFSNLRRLEVLLFDGNYIGENYTSNPAFLNLIYISSKDDASCMPYYEDDHTPDRSGRYGIITSPANGVLPTFHVPVSQNNTKIWDYYGTCHVGDIHGDIIISPQVLTERQISNSVVKIVPAFENAVKIVGSFCYSDCISIKEIPDFNEGLKAIGAGFAVNCISLKRIGTLPSSLIDLEGGFCAGCLALENVDNVFDKFPDNMHIPPNLFEQCISLKHIKLPKNITGIAEYFLYRCISLENVDLINFSEDPEMITIGTNFLSYCTSLKHFGGLDIKQDASNIKMGYNFLKGCSSLTELPPFPPNTAFNSYGFCEDCVSLKYVDLAGQPADGLSISGGAFKGCNAIEEIRVSSSYYPDYMDSEDWIEFRSKFFHEDRG
ncbi:hypothetical protein AGMMS49995_10410 [Endomicrobiia bacterium]|nr:hypothetical protein AGMMS49995_10410 [Endomicrobiia bacterium]